MIVSTQPSEPYAFARFRAIHETCSTVPGNIVVYFNKEIEQNPEAPGFWDMWRAIFENYGFRKGDYIVASEPYGQRLAEELGGVFMPYDMHRTVYPCKATWVREDVIKYWKYMIPEFRKQFVKRVTIFGAESTGKTTLAKDLGLWYAAPWLFEWARPYLEAVGAELTRQKMTNIWYGQKALQDHANSFVDSPVIFQDTDLFSTVGYWNNWDLKGPTELWLDAQDRLSDLYLITPSNIPFEQDQLRYGGDQRELPDQYWIDLCEENKLNYKVLTTSDPGDRLREAAGYVDDLIGIDLTYERKHND